MHSISHQTIDRLSLPSTDLADSHLPPATRPCYRRSRLTAWLALTLSCLVLCRAGHGASLAPPHLDAHLSTTYHDDLPGLIDKRSIRVLTTVNRTNFFISDGHLVGYEYALLKDYERYLNKRINDEHLNIVLQFVPVARDKLLPYLVKGYGDIAAAGLTITVERQAEAAFTQPYLTGIDEIVVTRKGAYEFQDILDLSGRTIFVRKSSSYYHSLMDLNVKLQQQGLDPVHIALAPEELETENILELVNCGGVSITVSDSHIAKAWNKIFRNIELHTNLTLRRDSKIAWMVRRDNPKLLASLNKFLESHKKGTLRGNIYFKRYYQDARKLRVPQDIENGEKIKKYEAIIKKYAQRYDFDWLLILAVAVQESGLDHNTTSPSGAVGLMQILPSTAGGKRIGIADVTLVENNIHAGVKYLAHLRDHYFSDPAIQPRDRIRLTLAAYNAGPAKIQKARDLAEQMGLNPNLWFRHVELAVLRLIGNETVSYVNNINTYVLLYRTWEKRDDL